MNTVFSQEEVNTGRQREFDYLKGIFMLFIYLIHAFQATMSPEDPIIQGVYIFATMSGAAIFIFVMGFGTVYSKNVSPAEFVKGGVRMVLYQYLNNIAYVAALLLPYPFVSGKLSETGMESFKFLLEMYIQYTNIFFITGIIYIVLALYKKLNMKIAGYLITGVAVSIVAPFLPAADIIKMAMVEVERRLREGGFASSMILQVHDELDFSAVREEVDALAAMVKEVMEGIVDLEVPLMVDVRWAPNWAEAH